MFPLQNRGANARDTITHSPPNRTPQSRPPAAAPAVKMITKFMTEVTAKFNPFSACAKPARLFLTRLPPNARATGMKITSSVLPRTAKEPSSVYVKFSTYICHGWFLFFFFFPSGERLA